MADFNQIKHEFMNRTYTNQKQMESVFGIQRDKFKQNPIWKIIDERKEKGVPIDQLHNDAQLKLRASDLMFALFHEFDLEKKDNMYATLIMNIALNYGLRVANEVSSNMTTGTVKEAWLELYVVLSRRKTIDKKYVLGLIPLELT